MQPNTTKLLKISHLTGEVVGSFSAFSESAPADMLCGVFAVSKNVFMELGGFDYKRYTGNHYREETDFHLRALQKGYKLIYDPRIIGFHYHQKSGGQRSNILLYEYYTVRNHALFLSRFFGFKTLPMLALFAVNRIASLCVTSHFNKIVPSQAFSRYETFEPENCVNFNSSRGYY